MRPRVQMLLLLAGCLSVVAPDAPAATLAVDSTADELIPGNGECTLREALLNANIDDDATAGDCPAGAGPDEVLLPAGHYALQIPGAGEDGGGAGDLDVHGELVLRGAGRGSTRIHGAEVDRVLDVLAGAFLWVEGLTLSGGATEGSGGGVRNAGWLVVRDSDVDGNGAQFGGGIANLDGVVDVRDSAITRNGFSVVPFGFGAGGGIYNEGGSVFVERSTISENEDVSGDGDGGGLYNAGSMGIVESTISDNFADEFGGGIATGGGLLALTRSTVAANLAAFGGGIDSLGALAVVNSTVSTNLGTLGDLDFLAEAGSVVLAHSTVGSFQGFVLDAPITTWSSIFGTCSASGFDDRGGNIVATPGPCTTSDPSSLSGIDPMLGPLQDNGGPTATHALLPGSPAIDAADGAACPDTDQRGVPRPLAGGGDEVPGCDIGAYERARLLEVDVQPGGDPNRIHLLSRGTTSVAILGSEDLDVREVDVTTLAFGPDGAAPASRGYRQDVDGDGVKDLVSHYWPWETGIAFGDGEACVTGELRGGEPFVGCDSIQGVPACGLGMELALLLPWLARLRARRLVAGGRADAPRGGS